MGDRALHSLNLEQLLGAKTVGVFNHSSWLGLGWLLAVVWRDPAPNPLVQVNCMGCGSRVNGKA